MANLPSGTVTFLFTDVEGSAYLWEQHPAAMRLATARHDILVEAVVGRIGGAVVRPRGEGDSRFAVFARATDAVTAAAALQQALTAEPWATPTPLRVRLGLHTGEADLRDGDYYGTAVNRCARLRAIAHGGQILISQATRDLVGLALIDGVTLRDLGEHRLRDLTASEHVYQLVAPGLPSEFPPLHSLDALPNNLPRQLTSFVGREREIAEVQRLLGSSPLVTLTGPGGSGKTRLALRVAADVVEQYRDGVWLVELAPLADSLLVPKVLAEVLSVPEQPGRDLREALADVLRRKQLLLVLDNCEHVVQACAELVAALLRACPDLRVLATSRQSLHIDGETTWRVPSLTISPVESLPSVEALARHDAPRLFLERARAVLPGFAASDQNLPTIVRLCARLDGIPLAIELAAARVRALGLDQIDARLDDRFRILTGGNRTAPPRQQTLRATADWSFDLLSERERTLFRRLAVFTGGWTLEAAEAVGAGDGLAADKVLDLLAELVDKSLVIADDTGGTVRYHLLETMREYGWEKLRAVGEEPAIRGRHRDWFLALAEDANRRLRGSEQVELLAHLEREHDNFRSALTWCLANDGDSEAALRLSGALAWFWRIHGHVGEGRRWLDQVLTNPSPTAKATWIRAVNGAGFLAFAQDDLDRAIGLFAESLRAAREQDNRSEVAWALHGMGRATWGKRDYVEATTILEESLATFRDLGDNTGAAYSLFWLANVVRERDEHAAASALYAEALDTAREAGDIWLTAWILISSAHLAFSRRDVERAALLYGEGLLQSHKIGAPWGLSECLWGMAKVVVARGHFERAARLFGADRALVVRIGRYRDPAESIDPHRVLDIGNVRAALGVPRFETLAAEGQAMSLNEAVAYALAADEAPIRQPSSVEPSATSDASMPLTTREREVAVLIARGLTNREIAQALVITRRTADTHVMNILTKLELHSRAQVAAWAVEHRLLASADHR
jgi:predicted ATPase/class 3 adenylate cyclase/DNA-binding CsgD family transcriptional regulator